ncbi:MAG: hypothetical protein AB7D57_07025 [Desulfovibrionaceae bacterium]
MRCPYRQVLKIHGEAGQLGKLVEEVGELSDALLLYTGLNAQDGVEMGKAHVIEECADVLNVIRSLDLAWGGKVEAMARTKMLRQQIREL